ncbi:MAG: hypothetical protein ACI3YC_02705 [Alloprevotella sp.]
MKYEEAQIEEILSRFVKAETTLEEERRLADFFASAPSVPPRWRAFAILFAGIDAGALKSGDDARQRSEKPAQPLRPVRKPCRRRLWLSVASVAAVLCLCFLLGRMAWQEEESAANRESAAVTSVSQPSLPPARSSEPACVAQPPPPSQSCTPSSVVKKQSSARKPAKATRMPSRSKTLATEHGGETIIAAAEQENIPTAGDEQQTDFSQHIVSAAFTYSEHSQLDERAIRERNRVRAEVMEQYAHLSF